jgi:hypothetical protein
METNFSMMKESVSLVEDGTQLASVLRERPACKINSHRDDSHLLSIQELYVLCGVFKMNVPEPESICGWDNPINNNSPVLSCRRMCPRNTDSLT